MTTELVRKVDVPDGIHGDWQGSWCRETTETVR